MLGPIIPKHIISFVLFFKFNSTSMHLRSGKSTYNIYKSIIHPSKDIVRQEYLIADAYHELECSLYPLDQALVQLVHLLVHLPLQEPDWAWVVAAASQAWASSPAQPSGGGPEGADPGPTSCRP